jgi:hypothetical protein
MNARTATAPDLFAATYAGPALPPHVADGLRQLEQSPALWPVADWRGVVTKVSAFAWRWHAEAAAAGWSDLQLYGLHRHASYANLAGMGAAWLVAKSGHLAVAVDREAFMLVTKSSSRLRIYRREIDPGAVLAWELCGPQSNEAVRAEVTVTSAKR